MTIRMGSFSFRPRLVTTVATIAFVALTLWLGRWQVDGRHEKEALQSLLEARMHEAPVQLRGPVPAAQPLLYGHAVAKGEWLADTQFSLNTQAPDGPAEVRGLAATPPRRYLELSTDTVSGNVWQNLSIERYQDRSGLTLLPVVVLPDASTPGLAPVHEKPDAGIAKHEEYALTWFSLAATALALWLALNIRRQE